MKIAHLNICGLEGKIDDLKIDMHGSPIDILYTLSETHLTDRVPDQKFDIPGYKLYRNDRERDPVGYGGVVTYVSLSFTSDRKDELETPDAECLWTEIKLPKSRPILIASHRYIELHR